MSTETASLLLYSVTGVALLAWAWGTIYLFKGFRPPAPPEPHLVDAATPPPHLVVGSVEVAGSPEELCDKAAAVLAASNMTPIGALAIVSKTNREISFEGAEDMVGGQLGGRLVRLGRLHFQPRGSQHTTVDYAVDVNRSSALLWVGGLFCALGLIAIVVGFVVIHTFVVDNPDPAVRWQTVQMAQTVHFLWPPFLFGALYRRGNRVVDRYLVHLLRNLPYVK